MTEQDRERRRRRGARGRRGAAVAALGLAALGALGAAAPAADTGDGGISLADAVARALARSPAVIAQEHAVAATEAKAAQAESAWLPRVSASAWYRVSGPVPELVFDTGIALPGASGPLTIRRELGTPHSAGVSATVGWRALDFGARDARIAAAEALARAARADGAARAAEIAFATRAAYLTARLDDEVVAVTGRALGAARADLETAENRRRTGLAGDLPAAAASSRVAELEARLADATESGVAAREALALLLGLPPGAPMTLSDDLGALAPVSAGDGAPGAAGLDETPTVARLRASEAALAEEDTARARSRLPTLDLFVQGAFQYPKTFVETDEAGVTWAAGVSLSWDAFDGGLVSAQREELAAKRAELAALADASREETARAVTQAAAQARTARAALAAGERQVAAAEVYVKAARGALAAGTGTDLEVRSAETALDQARLGLVRARFGAAMAEAQRLRALGVTAAPGRGGMDTTTTPESTP